MRLDLHAVEVQVRAVVAGGEMPRHVRHVLYQFRRRRWGAAGELEAAIHHPRVAAVHILEVREPVRREDRGGAERTRDRRLEVVAHRDPEPVARPNRDGRPKIFLTLILTRLERKS